MTELHPRHGGFRWIDRPDGAGRRLTADEVRHFDEYGYVLVDDAFTPDEIGRVRDEIDAAERNSGDAGFDTDGGRIDIAAKDEITFTVHLVRRSAVVRAFTRHRALVDICHDLVGDDVRLYWDQAVYKKHEPDREFPWHQDNGYAFVEPQQYLTCWIPLVDATLDNGCPWILPGRHRHGTLAHRATPVGWRCIEPDDPQLLDAVPVEAPVGSVVVFSSLTPHRTGPNRTSDTRKSYIVQYAPDGAEVVVAGTGLRVRQDDPHRQYEVLRDGLAVVDT